MMNKEMDAKEALARLSAYCSVAERCRADVEEKLFRWGLDSEARESIVLALEKDRFLDEKRYCCAFIRDKYLFARWGKVKIGQALRAKHLSPNVYEPLLDKVIDESDYLSGLRSLLAAKRKTVRAANARELEGKLVRFALGRGFAMDDIRRCMDISEENE